MELFKLPEHLAKIISPNENPGPVYRIIPLYESAEMTDFLLTAIIAGVMEEIKEYYHVDNICNKHLHIKTKVDRQGISDVVNEGIKNAVAHGCKNINPDGHIIYGTFYGKQGICHGFRDEGDYFSKKSTKNMFEKKTPVQEFSKEVKDLSGFGCGVDMIYNASDIIFVDTTQNTLFTVQYRSRIELPPDPSS